MKALFLILIFYLLYSITYIGEILSFFIRLVNLSALYFWPWHLLTLPWLIFWYYFLSFFLVLTGYIKTIL
jgi:hypothetical protein